MSVSQAPANEPLPIASPAVSDATCEGNGIWIELNRVHFPVTTLGPGRRIGLWIQGCSIRCTGCVSRDTWATRPEMRVRVAELVERLGPWLAQADGVTVSGGEPLDQPDALRCLLTALRDRFAGDLLVYTGHGSEHVFGRHAWIASAADVVISEPYLPSAGASRIWRGSDNQRVHLLTSLGRQRFGDDADARNWQMQRTLDVCVNDGEVWMAGIPRAGDLQRLRLALRSRGYEAVGSDQSTPIIRA